MNDVEEAVRLSEALISRRSGVVTELVPQKRGPDEPAPPHLWNATLAHHSFRNAPVVTRMAAGKGRTEAEAKLSALGEAIERYCAVRWDQSRVRVGRPSANALTPPECVLYSEAQHAAGCTFAQWRAESDTSWVSGVELPTGAPVDLPASLVYLIAPPPRHGDNFTEITSNGLAAGKDLTQAIIGGLNEIIERDAFMITWLNRLPATEIATPTRGCHAAAIIRHYARFGVSVRLLSLHTDQAPFVVMAVAEDPTDGGIFRMIGLGCDVDPVTAVDKAVFEMCQLRPGMKMRMQAPDYQTRLLSYAAVQTLDDHPLFHAIPAHAAEFDFLAQTGAVVELDKLDRPADTRPAAVLERIAEAATATGARVAYADITTPDIAALGPRVVRAFISGFQPIHFGFAQGRLGGRRLYEAPVAWGMRDTPLNEAELNQCPHPLA